jgi:PRTRC genetic system protein C
MEVLTIARKFKYNSVTLPDPNADMSPEEVREFFATQFPELLNAVVEGPVTKDNTSTYTFTRAAGAKGAVQPASAAEIVVRVAQAPRRSTVDALVLAAKASEHSRASSLIGAVAASRASQGRPMFMPSQAYGIWG